MNPAQEIEKRALELGFLACGLVSARFLGEEEERLRTWLDRGYQGSMGYLERNVEKRLDPRLLVPGTQTIVSLAYNYFPQKSQKIESPKIAKYAYGEDYHRVVKDRCFELLQHIQTLFPDVQARVFVDSAPVMERQWAQLAGLGWIGKNSLLLRKGVGSFFFLAEIFLDVSIEATPVIQSDHCGTCTRCIDACPTQAIVQDQVIDATKCISYLSIEKSEPLEESELEMMHGWLFGCDICQDVCPWNRFSEPHEEPRFEASELIDWDLEEWKTLQESQFNNAFKKSPIARMGFDKAQQLLNQFQKDSDL
jgi:epoxyqueuosine reductase